jgi:hypothetical protein
VNGSSLPSVLNKLPEEKAQSLFLDTLRQLSKDLDMDSELFVNVGRNQLQELEQIVALHLHTRTAGKKSALQHLLYRADISEREYRKILRDSEGRDTETLLAPVFIFRAFTKCYTRMLSSEGKL